MDTALSIVVLFAVAYLVPSIRILILVILTLCVVASGMTLLKDQLPLFKQELGRLKLQRTDSKLGDTEQVDGKHIQYWLDDHPFEKTEVVVQTMILLIFGMSFFRTFAIILILICCVARVAILGMLLIRDHIPLFEEEMGKWKLQGNGSKQADRELIDCKEVDPRVI